MTLFKIEKYRIMLFLSEGSLLKPYHCKRHMIHIEFSEAEMKALHYERYHHPHPRVQRKMEALWLKSQKLSHPEICRLTGISSRSLQRYLKDYVQGGLEKLKELNFRQPQSALAPHQRTLEAYFREHPPATVNEAMEHIAAQTGIHRRPTQVRAFLKGMGMKFLKVGMIPAKADVQAQETFKTTLLKPRLQEAQAGQRVVLFGDAAHFVRAPFLGFLWCFERFFVKAPSGRQRFNVLGALDVMTHRLMTVTNDSYINAQSVCDLLWQLHRFYVDLPVTLILDNARYQRCQLVQDLAESLHIEILYLPTYSPNLNLIERLWKFVKKECLYSKYYPDFPDSYPNSFKGSFDGKILQEPRMA